uniref:Uncharacterized protein n=1 Tax=termite gut metagenome TaxID=433724 RepID=S0DGN6_9ZZZZ
MIEISAEIYCALAARLRQEIGMADWFNGAVEYETEELHARLVLTAIVYRRTETAPEGTRRPIADIVPVWWELATVQECGCVTNDFSFSELKPYLIEYEQ